MILEGDKMAEGSKSLTFESDKIEKWKRAYKECKKYKSKIIKDKYDEYVSDVKEQYEKDLKYRSTIEFKTLTSFFRFVKKRSSIYLNLSKDEKSKYKFEARNKAANTLMQVSSELLNQLGGIRIEALDEGLSPDAIDETDVSIDTKFKNCITYYVQDINYLSKRALVNRTSFRIYIIITGKSTGLLNVGNVFCNSEFSFSKYDLYDVNGRLIEGYTDKDFRKRKIFRACEVPAVNKLNISLPCGLGKAVGLLGKTFVGNLEIEIKVYISPNDWMASRILESTSVGGRKLGDYLVDGDKVTLKGPLLTKSEI